MTLRSMSLAVAVPIVLLSAGCRHETPEDEAAPVITVDVAPVLLSTIQQTVRVDAVIFPKQQAAIVPKIAAPIHALHVQRGSTVRAGQLLVELENNDLSSAAEESRAAARLADATYETTARANVPEAAQRAELEVKAAKDALDAQQAVYDSRQALFKEGAIAQKDVNDAQVAVSQARTQYETARTQLANLQGFSREQQLKAAAAQRDVAQAHRAAADAQLGYSRLVSPIDGIVSDLPFYPGESAPSGAPVVTVMEISQVIAKAHVAQTDAVKLALGNDVNLIAAGGLSVPGKVTQISPTLDPGSSTVEIWVQAGNPDGALRVGSAVRAELIARSIADALVVPEAAVLTGSTGSTFTIVIGEDNKPRLRKVTVGVRDNGRAQITEGLESGQRVATTGAFEIFKLDEDVRAAALVKVAPAKEEEEEPDEN